VKILVTGATGFVAKHLIPKLNNYDYKLVVRALSNDYNSKSQIIYDMDNLEIFRDSIKEYNPDVVIHLASFLTSADDINNIKNIVESNILFTSYLLEALKETKLKLFINTGTFAEFYNNDEKQNPAYFYAASKLAVRPIIQYFKNLRGFRSINIIPYSIYGGESKSKKVIDFIIDSTKSKEPIAMTSGEQILDFIHIYDVIDFYIYCIENIELLKDDLDYHLGTGIGTSIKQLANLIDKEIDGKVNINWGMKDYRPLDIMKAIAPISKFKKELNWHPRISIEDGIKKIIHKEIK
jgi:nucleoside-diphosphate-sugar epimerase